MLWLVEALERRPGTEVFVRIAERGEGNSALATLLSLERMLLRRSKPGGADRIDRAELGGRFSEPAGFKPDIIIDLCDGDRPAMSSDAIRLRPLYDGRPGETALASALFFRGTPEIATERILPGDDAGSVIAQGFASLEAAAGVGGGIEAVGSRAIALLLKALAVAKQDLPLRSVPLLQNRRIGQRDILLRSAKTVARAAARAANHHCCQG
jgi:hypothetical protein